MKLNKFKVEQLSISELQKAIGGNYEFAIEPPVSYCRRRSHVAQNDGDHPEDDA